MHYGMGSITRCRDVVAAEFDYCSDLNTTRFLRRMIQAEKPDLIAFTGTKLNLLNLFLRISTYSKKLWLYYCVMNLESVNSLCSILCCLMN